MDYFEQPISAELFQEKYMVNGETSVQEVLSGIAEDIAQAERTKAKRLYWADSFYQLMASGKFIPGGRILANSRPNTKNRYYSNCYTIDVEDTIEGIYEALKEDAIISATGGGVGFNISKLRPDGTPTSKGGKSSGPLSFLKVFNESAKQISVAGNRRGAHIAIMNIDHPDIEAFITCKQGDKNKALDRFNISVGITDDFMHAVGADLDWELRFEGKVYKTVKAKYLYDLIVGNAFAHNEPGVFFLDTAEYYNNGYWAFRVDRTNPCGEISMPAYSLCDLGAFNFAKYVKGTPFTHDAYFDLEEFNKDVPTAIRFLDNVLDRTKYPLKKIEDFSRQWRRIGLGFTGLADALAMMHITYGSEESFNACHMLGKALRDGAYAASVSLAREKGKFPACKKGYLGYANFIKELPVKLQRDVRKYGLRNIAMLTAAPTGTTSLTLGQNCSSGIEPIFALSYTRTILTGVAEETRQEAVVDYAWNKYVNMHGLPEDGAVPDYFVTTESLDPYAGVKVQAILQKYIDHSISKCIGANSLVTTSRGLQYMHELVLHKTEGQFAPINNLQVLNMDGEAETTTASYYNGTKPVKVITLTNGLRLNTTLEHKLMTPTGWIPAMNLTTDQSLHLQTPTNYTWEK